MIQQDDPRFRHLRKKVALFAAVAFLVVAGVVLSIGKENDLFTKKYELALTVEKGTGFTRGMPVKLSGFRIGRVKSISLNEDAKVDVVLQIGNKYRKWIRRDSTARLVKEGLVGDAIIEVSAGSPDVAVLQDSERLPFVKTKALDEVADELAEKVKPVLIEVRDIVGYINDPKGDIKESMRNFNQLSKNLELTRQRADLLLVTAGGRMDSLSGSFATVLDETHATVKRANASLTRVDEKLPVLLQSAGNSLQNLETVSRDLKEVEQKVLPAVPSLVQKASDTLDDTGSVINATKTVWPLSGRISAPKEKEFVPGDSHD